MCTKYTPSHYCVYLIFCVRYASFVNCIKFPIVFNSSGKSFVDKLCSNKVIQPQSPQKSSQILCAHKPYFLIPGHIYCETFSHGAFVSYGMILKILIICIHVYNINCIIYMCENVSNNLCGKIKSHCRAICDWIS